MQPQLIFLGAPGSGKGTQATRLIKECGYQHLSTGDLLRKEVKEASELGKRVTAIMNAGKLVDDNTVLELLKKNTDLASGAYIFDGFPRNGDQAKLLDEVVLKGSNSKAVYFEIDLDLLFDRLVNRRTCGKCGEIYNLKFKAPAQAGVCDKCGSTELNQRKDDVAETVKHRLDVFKETIEPVLKHYESEGRLVRLDASNGSDEVFSSLKSLI
ncbi:MAG: adenylate kinase [Bdellovibrio sp. CG12_big_fil_rev_8_21_14_0_65_39_13]|nr:MAG: adenylate kinase [Bdellovibrio sp. CG22_combo_CG10-13_8_21_14_all_39_27]PIQ62635.1 MAG: adenylate kinase [Bdellovibrio sp. CG12_big_fil_rev_8_21_14_0_65_39_13]PIR36990.1 MAG: adenylate kinase [Bdellovibrio sp. CG11_big_fil_rev_8_21_14_0_20_39_38]PJB54619.1 MAG: adenylate kinase [Bdellovibrio sp. CG_4_9_14_3_um_filter_39_7]